MKWEAGISGMRRGWCGISAFLCWGVKRIGFGVGSEVSLESSRFNGFNGRHPAKVLVRM